jgi:hypothetical protein
MEQGFEYIRDSIIKALGGYTNKEVHELKKSLHKGLKAMKTSEQLSDDELENLRIYRADKLLHKGMAKLRAERVK